MHQLIELIGDDAAGAVEALSAFSLCSRCTGRLFAKRLHGMDNALIGSRVKELSGLADPGDEECYLCHGLFRKLDDLASIPLQELAGWEFETLWVGSRLEFGTRQREEEILASHSFPDAEPFKVEVNRELGKRLSALTGREGRMTNPDMLVIIDTAFRTFELDPSPLFIYGRYRKLVRGIPQTRWPCRKCHGRGCSYCGNRGKMYETSVEELIAPPLMEASGASEHFFHGMGREDIDAVMLGSGRPFIMELSKPRRRKFGLAQVQDGINRLNEGRVEVADLRPSSKEEVRELKAAAPVKKYSITFRTISKINKQLLGEVVSKLSGAKLAQRTPVRVSHRRADIVRERTVYSCSLSSSEGDVITLEIEAESGTYIKELVTGDGGRTVPSVAGLLGAECEVVSLDVSEVNTGAGEKW